MFARFAQSPSVPLFFVALLLSLWLTPLTAGLARALGAVDRPDGRKIHAREVPRLGGLAIAAALLFSLLLFVPPSRRFAGYLAGAMIVAVAGFVDDIVRLRPAPKFLLQALAASVFMAVSGASLSTLGDFMGVGEVRTGWLAPAVTVFCMVGVMNAFNLSDGLDGLAGGLCAVACVYLAFFSWLDGDPLAKVLSLGLLGAVVGFLRYNTYPATLFMGDSGSLLIGYTLSAAAVLLVQEDGAGVRVGPVTVGTVLALPIIDTLLVMARRVSRGESPFRPDKTHLHHRLLDTGFPHEAVVSVLYAGMGAFGFLAWVTRGWPEGPAFAAVLALGGAIYGSAVLARRVRLRRVGTLPTGDGKAARSRFFRETSALLRKSTPAAIAVFAAGLLVPTAAVGTVPFSLGAAALCAAAVLAAVFPWTGRRSRSSVCYGVLFAGCACLVAALRVSPGTPAWVPAYLAAFSGLFLVWVFLKMKFRGHGKVALASPFEALAIGLSLFVPLVLAPALGYGDGVRNLLLVSIAQALCLHMALKVMVRRQPRRNLVFAGGLLLALLVIGAKGIVGGAVSPWPEPADTRRPGVLSALWAAPGDEGRPGRR